MGVHERRRLVLATALTIVAIPAVFIIERGNNGTDGSVDAGGGAAAAAAPSENSLVPQLPVYLENTIELPLPAVIDVAVPPSAPANETTARLTFKDYTTLGLDKPCSTVEAPSGAVVTVTNIDNGQSVTCINTLGMSVPVGADMAIDINLYVMLADLVEAPVPVRISWK